MSDNLIIFLLLITIPIGAILGIYLLNKYMNN